MKNLYVPDRYSERVDRLSLGLAPVDAVRQSRIAHPIRVTVERGAAKRRRMESHDSCLHALRWAKGAASEVVVRLADPLQRYVPRRLLIPLLEPDAADKRPWGDRVRAPWLYPAAAYDIGERATGLRGRARYAGGADAPWVRVAATTELGGVTVGRAQGDARGEFLLIIGCDAWPAAGLSEPLRLRVAVSGAPAAAAPAASQSDPLWALPVERLPAPGTDDAVSRGETPPASYTLSSARVVEFTLGRLKSEVAAFVLS